jgi:hypothetical protein
VVCGGDGGAVVVAQSLAWATELDGKGYELVCIDRHAGAQVVVRRDVCGVELTARRAASLGVLA